MNNLLLLSNSTMPGQAYLAWCKEAIRTFLAKSAGLMFIPYAGVTQSFDDYTKLVANGLADLGVDVAGIHESNNPKIAIEKADAIAIGGGNTFRLLKMLQDESLIDTIREAVMRGVPLVGWSAGSNVCCPTICTSNDMPIVEPPTFNALGLIDCQINPHYTEATLPNHGGESRDQRINEYLAINQTMTVLGVPEGSYLRIHDEKMTFHGTQLKVLQHNKPAQLIENNQAVVFHSAN